VKVTMDSSGAIKSYLPHELVNLTQGTTAYYLLHELVVC
jgi:hypothetical protein